MNTCDAGLFALYALGGNAVNVPSLAPLVTLDPTTLTILYALCPSGPGAPLLVLPLGLYFYVDILQSGGRA